MYIYICTLYICICVYVYMYICIYYITLHRGEFSPKDLKLELGKLDNSMENESGPDKTLLTYLR